MSGAKAEARGEPVDAASSGPELAAIWAQAADRVIGRDGGMPWHCPADFAFFRERTMGHPVIMGRATWESFPQRFRPLPGRTNIVLSRTVSPGEHDGGRWVGDLPEALRVAVDAPGGSERIWLLGGASLYARALAAEDLPVVLAGRVNRVLITQLEAEVPGDARAPRLGPEWSLRELASGVDPKARVAGPDGALTPMELPYRFLEATR